MNDIVVPDFFQKVLPTIDKWDKKYVNKIYKKYKDTKVPAFAKFSSFFADPRLWGLVGIVFTITGFIQEDFTHLITFVSGFFQSFLLYYILKKSIKRERPFQQIESIERLDKTGHGFSFPSGHCHHSTIMVGLFWLSFYNHPWVIIILLIYNVVVGFSRIVLGVHFISDVIVGICEGYLMLFFHWFLTKNFYLILNQLILKILL
ncbi:phosphatase PAP2 family protein [Promethearchaeum syntrophicum]|uniref:Phosphatase PAP2 family protein n=1 Tax=Promethearchaeum syntrophicum TaxID=2594042 RepID=A0A5B9DCS8_9ARCH|nr:phosphatase PAP2 family protein [Candidatus Prometheoarchaeum syntrophicum]QEE16506.1 Undecaprenyl-diphosphatase [Candidatus Prometheoarchaeum syntrophicum]